MKPFKMVCSKCKTTSYTITRDIRTSPQTDPLVGLVFSCRCGKQLFGPQIREEYERQKSAYEASADTRLQEQREREARLLQEREEKEALRKAYAYRAEYLARKRQDEEPEAPETPEHALYEVEDDASPESGAELATPDEDAENDEDRCAWHMCGKLKRKNSKYCSRACSNKNARHRHKQRKGKKGEKVDASAAA